MFKNDSFFKKLSRFDTFKYLKIKLSINASTCINRPFDFCQHCILNQMQFKSIKMSSGINDFVRICYVKDNIVSH